MPQPVTHEDYLLKTTLRLDEFHNLTREEQDFIFYRHCFAQTWLLSDILARLKTQELAQKATDKANAETLAHIAQLLEDYLALQTTRDRYADEIQTLCDDKADEEFKALDGRLEHISHLLQELLAFEKDAFKNATAPTGEPISFGQATAPHDEVKTKGGYIVAPTVKIEPPEPYSQKWWDMYAPRMVKAVAALNRVVDDKLTATSKPPKMWHEQPESATIARAGDD